METTQEPGACALFCVPCPGRRLYGGQEYRSLLPMEAAGDGWEERPAREPKDPSPQKWVALLRRLDCCHGVAGGWKRRAPQFRYDPVSYALNFDNGDDSQPAAATTVDAALPFLGFSPANDSCI